MMEARSEGRASPASTRQQRRRRRTTSRAHQEVVLYRPPSTFRNASLVARLRLGAPRPFPALLEAGRDREPGQLHGATSSLSPPPPFPAETAILFGTKLDRGAETLVIQGVRPWGISLRPFGPHPFTRQAAFARGQPRSLTPGFPAVSLSRISLPLRVSGILRAKFLTPSTDETN